jgi:hypothetical protein
LVAAVVAVAAGDVVAAVVNPAASPVLAIGSQVIDLTPGPVKEWAIAWFGTADKAVLVGCVLAGTVALAAAAGIVSRDRPRAGAGILAAMALLVLVITLARDDARSADALPALITAPVAIVALLGLRGMELRGVVQGDEPGQLVDAGRRTVLASLSLLATGALLGMLGSGLRRRNAVPVDVALPKPTKPIKPLPRGLGREGITPLRSSNRSFYRIDTA